MTDEELAEQTAAYAQMRRKREQQGLVDFLAALPSLLFIAVITFMML